MIHSVDSLRLAETIEKEAEKKNVVVPILIEVNVAQEESKFGLKPEEVLSFIEQIASFPHIQIKGLMTIAPYVENAEENREIFREPVFSVQEITQYKTNKIGDLKWAF